MAKPKQLKKKCDVLYSKIIRSVGYCENESCGKSYGVQLQCAHTISRRYSATRTDLRNSSCLCAGCHMYYTQWPREFSHYITDKIGSELYDELKAKAETPTKVDWQDRHDFLKDVWKRIEEGELTLSEAREYEA